ncbi:MAG: tetratricopeptide repeat protein [bacterium]|nr:tetratricopeptide repeat protein [bacterium]
MKRTLFSHTVLFVSFVLLVVLPGATGAKAAEQKKTADPIILQKQTKNPQDEQFRQKLSLARKLIDSKNWQGAAAVLEGLYETNPTHGVVVNQLMQCLDHLKQYPKAVDLVKRQIARQTNNFHLHLRLAEYFVKQDSLDAAMSVYNQTIGMVINNNIGSYQSIINNMVLFGFQDRAIDLIDSLRLTLTDSSLFALQRGGILEQKREYREATREFYMLLGDSSRSAINAENKIISLLEFPTSSDAALEVLTNAVDKSADQKLYKILSDFYLKKQQFEPAFEYAVRRDSTGNQKGVGLLSFLRNCRERDLHEETIRMARYILNNIQNSPILPETYFIYAGALAEAARYDEAISVYDTIFASLPRPQDKASALFEIGRIYANRMDDCDRALMMYDSIIASFPAGIGYVDALLARPDCYIRLGEYDKAREDFGKLRLRQLDENRREAIEYNLALIDFFEKKFDSCQVAFRKLMLDFPSGYYVNDALRLLMVINEAEGDNDLLYLYSSAEMFKKRGMPDSTKNRYEALTRSINRVLADNALFGLINLSMAEGDTVSALSSVKKLAEEFPESYYLPYGLKLQADIWWLDEARRVEAAQEYRSLLEEYPDYPFVSKVRERLREIETGRPVG